MNLYLPDVGNERNISSASYNIIKKIVLSFTRNIFTMVTIYRCKNTDCTTSASTTCLLSTRQRPPAAKTYWDNLEEDSLMSSLGRNFNELESDFTIFSLEPFNCFQFLLVAVVKHVIFSMVIFTRPIIQCTQYNDNSIPRFVVVWRKYLKKKWKANDVLNMQRTTTKVNCDIALSVRRRWQEVEIKISHHLGREKMS